RPRRSCAAVDLPGLFDVLDVGEVVLKVLGRVFLDAMLFQEAVELVARGDAQERAELVARQASLAVSFDADGFERGANGVPAPRGEVGRQLVGNFQLN